ncbi:MAG TPA: FAD-binding protein [Nocardioides sp.]|uniref:FAD-binding oxidoreductase n=1 Tax=Nocardioides sp. TaxID=35761 RepID=UPI002E33D112|nr:FAD-binding protein [Nocardioides sp.]HEX5087430.1 FAD-binding protein [Nocardioides sp.]
MTVLETGEVLRPGDEGYDEAARVFFATGRPALVVRPRDADEVAAAVRQAARDGLALSVRSGGHSAVGHSTNTDGMVIDLAHLDAVEVLDGRRVRVGGGATWGQVAAALDPHDLGLTSGDTKDVGVGGLTLGGGIGWMVRKHGLAIDNLVAARVVTADGRLVTASAEENPDLFWALRGGGGNFGVVVELEFVAQQVASVHYGTVAYQLDGVGDLVRRWRDAMQAAPEELSSTLALMPPMGEGPRQAMLLLCYAGDPGTPVEQADAAIEPLLELGQVGKASITERRYADVLEEAQSLPPGLRLIMRNTLVRALDDEVIGAIERMHGGPTPSMIALRSLGGAVARVAAGATAFAHRDAEAMVVGGLVLPEQLGAAEVEGALTLWRDVAALGSGTYVNFQGSATPEDVAKAYPPATYARLAEVKRSYDPTNVFALNHNVEPASAEDVEGPAA